MHFHELLVSNPTDHSLEVYCEPWGISFTLPADQSFRFVGMGEQPGEFDLVRNAESITVYAWPSSTCTIYQGDQIVMEIPIPVPGMPDGMTVRGFINAVLGKTE